MFVHKVTVTENRKKRVYIEILDQQPNRKKRPQPIARLGPLDLPTSKLDPVVSGLREFSQEKFFSAKEISAERIRSWGPVLVTRHLWQEIGLGAIISAACGRRVGEAAFALIANRLLEPFHQHGMDRWLEKTFVPDEHGCGLDPSRIRKSSSNSGTSTDDFWDNVVRRLAAKRNFIEKALFDTVNQICGVCEEVVLYNLQSVFVERMPPRRHLTGWPVPGPERNTRLHFGVIVCNGWPLALRFFGGTEPTVAQIKRCIEDTQRRFGFRKILFAAPSGTDEEKLHQLESIGFHYLVGVRRRRDPRAVEVIQGAGGQWVKIDSNTKVQEALLPAQTDASLQALSLEDTPTERYFLIHNRQKEKEEHAFRSSVVARALKALDEVKHAVNARRLRKPATIMARAERILARRKGYRYISWRITPQGHFQFWQDERKSSLQRAYEGISLLKTSHPNIPPSSALATYEGLRRLQNAFGTIHDTVPFRSTHLRLPDLEEHLANGQPGNLFAGHLLVNQIAFFVRCSLEKKLQQKKINLSLDDAVKELETVSLAELRFGREKHVVVSPGNRTARKILGALGIPNLQPPTPAPTASTPRSRK